MVLATFLGMCGRALHRARQAQVEALHLQALIDEAAATPIVDAPSAGRIHVIGRVTGESGAVVTAPFTGGDAVRARATLQTNVGQIVKIGTVRAAEGAYRESGATLSLAADDGELILFDADEELKSPEALRRNAGCAIFGIVFFAAAMIVAALVGYAR